MLETDLSEQGKGSHRWSVIQPIPSAEQCTVELARPWASCSWHHRTSGTRTWHQSEHHTGMKVFVRRKLLSSRTILNTHMGTHGIINAHAHICTHGILNANTYTHRQPLQKFLSSRTILNARAHVHTHAHTHGHPNTKGHNSKSTTLT